MGLRRGGKSSPVHERLPRVTGQSGMGSGWTLGSKVARWLATKRPEPCSNELREESLRETYLCRSES